MCRKFLTIDIIKFNFKANVEVIKELDKLNIIRNKDV